MYLTHLYPKPLGFEENETERFVFGAYTDAGREALERAASIYNVTCNIWFPITTEGLLFTVNNCICLNKNRLKYAFVSENDLRSIAVYNNYGNFSVGIRNSQHNS